MLHQLDTGNRALQVLKGLLEKSKQGIKQMYKDLGITCMLCPPVDSAKNIVDFPLYERHYKVRCMVASSICLCLGQAAKQ